ncbi:MAG: RING finger protein [Planctomycetota bacterium]
MRRTEELPRCPYCLADLLPDEERVRCERCTTPHHQECFGDHGGCAAYGCRGNLSVPSGQSIYLRQPIKILGGSAVQQVELANFLVNVRAQPRHRERPHLTRRPPYARVGFEDTELRAGSVLKGQAALFVPEPTRFRRLELELLQGIADPRPVTRGELTIQQDEPGMLVPGSYPFELELVAPDYSPPVDPFQLRLVLVLGMFKELRSEPRVVFLLKRRLTLPPHLAGLANVPEGNALVLPPPQARVRRRPAGPPSSEEVPALASSGEGPLAGQAAFARSGDGFLASIEHEAPAPAPPSLDDPFASNPAPGPRALPPPPREFPPPPQGDPFAGPDPFVLDWCTLQASSQHGPRPLAGRLFAPPNPASDRIEVAAPRWPQSAEFSLQVSGGRRLHRLALAVQASLVRPGGAEVTAEGFPALEEVVLVGQGGFLPALYDQHGGLDVVYRVPEPVIAAVTDARSRGAHNAALRLHLGVDAVDQAGRALPSDQRSITLTWV